MPLLLEMAHNRSQRILGDSHLEWELVDVFHLPTLRMVLGQLQSVDKVASMIAITKIINCALDKII